MDADGSAGGLPAAPEAVLNRRTLLQLGLGGLALSLLPLPRRAHARDPLVLGEFLLDPNGAVVDGDTVKVLGLDASLRLVGIDTEETFKKAEDKRDAKKDFAAYCKAKRGDGRFPAKFSTPAGEAAKTYAKAWFRGVQRVRLEYDEEDRTLGVYGRHLVHIYALKDARWHHYNVACVQDGWSPYFNKYGNSLRFHDVFLSAQAAAQAAKLGIWGADVDHYPDYDERLAWWNARATAIDHFAASHGNDPSYVRLGDPHAFDRLMNAEGQRRIVFGTLSSDPPPQGTPYRRYLSHQFHNDFTIVTFDKPALDRLDLDRFLGHYVYVEGIVSSYRNRPQFQAQGVLRVWQEP